MPGRGQRVGIPAHVNRRFLVARNHLTGLFFIRRNAGVTTAAEAGAGARAAVGATPTRQKLGDAAVVRLRRESSSRWSMEEVERTDVRMCRCKKDKNYMFFGGER